MLSLLGYYSKQVQDSAFYLIDQKMIDLIGSDTHHMRHFSLLPEVLEHKYYRKVCELELLNNNL